MAELKKPEPYFMSYFSITMIAISAIILSYMIYLASIHVRSLDKSPELASITPAVAAQLGGNPSVVNVGLYIMDYADFDMIGNKFTFSAVLWFLFDPSTISLDTLSKFSFQKGQIISVSAPSTRLVGGKLLARYNVRVTVKTNLSYALFPFESHVLHIVVDNNYVTPGEVKFKSSSGDFGIASEVATTGWKLTGVKVDSGYSVAQLGNSKSENDIYHPRLVFSLSYAHTGVRQPLTILLPLLLIFYMAIFSLSMDPETNYGSMLALSSGGVTGLLAYRFVIENLAPKVGYFMLSDYIFFLLLVSTCSVFFVNMGLVKFREKNRPYIIFFLHALVILAFIYMLRGIL